MRSKIFKKGLTAFDETGIVPIHTVKHKLHNMRTKALLGLAALAAGAVTCVAQNNVYSLNIVGYVNQPVQANKFYLLENPLTKANSGGNNVTNIISLDNSFDGTLLYTFENGGLVVAATYVADFGWFSDDPAKAVLTPGKGFYLFPTAGGTVTFVGEVTLSSTNTLTGGSKFSLVGSPYPAAMSLTALGLTGRDGDIVYRYSTTANKLSPVTYVADYGWYDDSAPNGGPVVGPNLNVGEGIFYFNPSSAFDWKQSFTVGP